jgi:hypothetical protein
MEGYFICTGTSGEAEYKFDENETVIRIYFSNKLVRDNTCDFKTWGTKKNKY